jgi:hypothetical protein
MLMGDYAGEKVALLAQLRLPLATSSNYIPPDKRILLPAPHAPHALPCAPGGGTDVLCSQYNPLEKLRYGTAEHNSSLAGA